jgi:thiol-disulfide isomerase/thioredoxin
MTHAVNWKDAGKRTLLARKDALTPMRRALLLLMMIAGISLVVWSSYRNLRDRRLAAQALEATHVTLIPDNPAAGVSTADSPAAPSPLLGKPAPPLSLKDLSGKQVSLADFKGHPLVVNFWGTYCAPCKIEMPWLETFSKKYAADGFDVIGVTYDSEVGKEVISKNVQKLGVTYPILLSDPKAEKDYLADTEVLPMSFYVDKSGKVVQVTAGLGSEDQLEAMVKQTIAAGAK